MATTTSTMLLSLLILAVAVINPTSAFVSKINTHASSLPSTVQLSASSSDDDQGPYGLSRRQIGELTIAGIGLGGSFLATREVTPQDYGLWGILPVGTYKQKKTLLEEIVPNTIWTLDQKFGILNVQVPVRTTIIKLDGGGLFVYNPVAPTPECLSYINDLVSKHGPVKHIVIGSVALEHKVYGSVLSQKFPKAQVWIQPGQYSFPVNLPSTFLGYPKNTKLIPQDPNDAPDDWKLSGLQYLTLGPFISRDGAFGETVFYHQATKTLICTDTVFEVNDKYEDIPKILLNDPTPIIYHARNTVTDIIDPADKRMLEQGYRRIVLFGLYFTPSGIVIKDVNTALAERRPDINPDFAGIYPWDWIGNKDIESFNALKGGLVVAPILQTLILNRNPIETLDFADKVAKWDIKRIIPCHFNNNLTKYNGNDFRNAYKFLEASGVPNGLPKPLDSDIAFLRQSEVGLIESGAIAKCPPLPGTNKVTREQILKETVYNCRDNICAQQSQP